MPTEFNESESNEEADMFATAPKDISHVTFYFDATPEDYEDSEFFFVKVETPNYVNDDLDSWYQAALDAMALDNPDMEGMRFLGAAIKYGSAKGGSGGEFYYAADGSDSQPDESPLGFLVQGRDFKGLGGGMEYRYGDLF